MQFETFESIPSVKYSLGIPILNPLISPLSLDNGLDSTLSIEVESSGSFPAMALSKTAASALDFVIGPI